MKVYLRFKNNRAEFHPDPIWNDGALGFLARDSIYAIARSLLLPVRLSVCLSVRHTGGSVKDGSR